MTKITHTSHSDIRRYSSDQRIIEYTLVGSVLKTHFKELMKLSECSYNSATKKGLIRESKKTAFLALIERINKVSDKRANASHAKTAAEAVARRSETSDNKYPRNPNECEHEDLGSLGYSTDFGEKVVCPYCGSLVEVW